SPESSFKMKTNLESAQCCRDTFEHSKGKMLVRSARLNADELPALALRFSFLEAYAGRSAVAALKPKPQPVEEQEEKARVFAEIKSVEPDYAGKVLTRKRKLIGN